MPLTGVVQTYLEFASFDDCDNHSWRFLDLKDPAIAASRCVEANGEMASLLAGHFNNVYLADMARESYENHTVCLVDDPELNMGCWVVDVAYRQFSLTAPFPFIAPIGQYLHETGFHEVGTRDRIAVANRS